MKYITLSTRMNLISMTKKMTLSMNVVEMNPENMRLI